jgi:hypothetical protein
LWVAGRLSSRLVAAGHSTPAAATTAISHRAGPEDDRLGSAAAAMAGMAELATSRHAEPAGSALTRDLSLLDRAQARTGGLHSPWWSRIAMLRAHGLRAFPEPALAGSREAGIRALPGHSWRMIATAGSPEATPARDQALQDARTLREWCVADLGGDPQALNDLISVLDAEQVLTTGVTAAARPVAERLDSLGRRDLAAEWRSTAGRSRGLIVAATWISPLGGSPAGEEPSPVLVDRTLRALDAPPRADDGSDIIVILRETRARRPDLPGRAGAGMPGLAVVVLRDGPPGVVFLPGLEVPQWPGEEFERVSAWAGNVVMATVLGMVGSPKRLVLVAAGPLARIPWAAASDESRTGRRYLIESCSVSSAPSARALRDALRYRPNRPAASLVVGSGVVAERAGGGQVTPDLPG